MTTIYNSRKSLRCLSASEQINKWVPFVWDATICNKREQIFDIYNNVDGFHIIMQRKKNLPWDKKV